MVKSALLFLFFLICTNDVHALQDIRIGISKNFPCKSNVFSRPLAKYDTDGLVSNGFMSLKYDIVILPSSFAWKFIRYFDYTEIKIFPFARLQTLGVIHPKGSRLLELSKQVNLIKDSDEEIQFRKFAANEKIEVQGKVNYVFDDELINGNEYYILSKEDFKKNKLAKKFDFLPIGEKSFLVFIHSPIKVNSYERFLKIERILKKSSCFSELLGDQITKMESKERPMDLKSLIIYEN